MRAVAVSRDRGFLDGLRRMVAESGLGWHLESVAGEVSALVDVREVVLIADVRGLGLAALDALEQLDASVTVVLVVEEESPALLLRALRLGVREVLRHPFSAQELAAAMRRVSSASRAGRGGRVAVFLSAKGGSGATFIAANLGHALSQVCGQQVLLVDLDWNFGDAALHLSEARPRLSVMDVLREGGRVDRALLGAAAQEVAPRFSVLAAPEEWGGEREVGAAEVEGLLRFAAGQFDWVLVDCGRGQSAAARGAVSVASVVHPVLQLSVPQLRAARKVIDGLRGLATGSQSIAPIVNRASGSAQELRLEDATRLMGCEVHAVVPNHTKSVAPAVNQGLPVAGLAPDSPVAKSLEELARRMSGQGRGAARGWLARLLAMRGAGAMDVATGSV